MFCKNCGQKIPDGGKFCVSCGTKIDDVPVVAPVEETVAPVEETVAPAETAAPSESAAPGETVTQNVSSSAPYYMNPQYGAIPPSAPGKKKKTGMIVGGVIAAAVVLILCAVIPNIKSIVNSIHRAGSPEKYLSWVLKNEEADVVDDFSSAYASYLELITAKNYEISLNAELGDDARDLIASQIGDASWLKEATVTASVGRTKDLLGVSASVSSQGNTLLSADVMVDVNAGDMYLGLPSMSDKYLSVGGEETGLSERELEELSEAFTGYDKIFDAMPDNSDVTKLTSSYVDTVIDSIGKESVAVKKNVNFRVGDISQKVTQITVTLDDKLARSVAKGVLEKMYTDKNLKNVFTKSVNDLSKSGVSELADLDADKLYNQFLNEVERELANIDSISFSEKANMILSVDKTGEIVGTTIASLDGNESFELMEVNQKGKVSQKLVLHDNWNMVEIYGNGKKSGKKITGNYVVSVDGAEIVTADVKDLDVDGMSKGEFSGEIIITPSRVIANQLGAYGVGSDYAYLIDSSIKINGGKIKVGILDGKDTVIAGSASFNASSNAKFAAPASKNIIELKDETSLVEYMNSLDYTGLIDGLVKIGVPESIISYIEMFSNMNPEDLLYYLY